VKDETLALVMRCPLISDGAKVTMAELLLHFGNGRLPSLNELKRVRNTVRSTVQLHIQELQEVGVLTKEYLTPTSVRMQFNEERLLELNGLTDVTTLRRWLSLDIPAAETKQPQQVAAAMKPRNQWQPHDALAYFDLLGNRKQPMLNKRSGMDQTRYYHTFRRLLKIYGGNKLQHMLEHYLHNFRRMHKNYTPDDLWSVHKKLDKNMSRIKT